MAEDSGGFSLIELIVTVVILGLILSGVAVMFANILTTQSNVTTQSDAMIHGQSFASSIEKAMRDGSAFSATSGSLKVQFGSGTSATCETFNASTAKVRLVGGAVTFTASGTNGIHYSFGAIGGNQSDPIPSTAAPVQFSGDAFLRNTTSVVLTCW